VARSSGSMASRWAAAGSIETEKNGPRMIGYENLWMPKAHLDEDQEEKAIVAAMAEDKRVG